MEGTLSADDRARAAMAAEILPDGLVSINAGGAVTYMNEPAERIVGMRRADVLWRDVREALPLQDRTGAMWWDLTDPWRPPNIRSGHREKLLTLPGGREVLATARYLRAGRNQPVRAILLGLRSAEARQRAEADHAALITTVAHELRSPLTGVKGFSSTLLAKWDKFSDEQKRFMVETIESDAERLTRLITDLLDISRMDAGRLHIHKQPVDVATTFGRHVDRLIAAGHAKEGFVIDVPAALPELWADPDRLDQVLTNLMENAVRHGRGTVTVAARGYRYEDGSEAVDVTVADQGDGIPERHRSLVFSRFWQGGHPGSTGLGLYLVKGMAQAHGGTALVEDAPGGGALVRVRFPSTVPEHLR